MLHQKLMLQWKLNVKKPGKGLFVNFFIKAATKKGELFVNIRSSRPEVFCKKGVLRNFTKFTGKHLCQSLFFNKVAGLACNISYKLWYVQTQNVAGVFKHHTWKLFLKDFYNHLYQLFTRVTELNGQKMIKMLPTYPCIRVFPCKMPWCLLKLQRNFPREHHTIIPVHLWIKIWSNDKCALIVAYTFRPLKQNYITGLVAESLKVVLKTK